MKRSQETGRRLRAWMVLAAVGSASWATGIAIDASAADPAVPVEMVGAGDTDFLALQTQFFNALYDAPQPTDIQYFSRGVSEARASLLAGNADFVLSGSPFTAAELAGRPTGGGEIIDVPVGITGLTVALVFARVGDLDQVVPATDPSCGGDDEIPELCIPTETPFTGEWRIPPDALAAQQLGLPASFQQNRLADWSSPINKAALGVDNLRMMSTFQPTPVAFQRTDSAASNVALQNYSRALATRAWPLILASNPDWSWAQLREQVSPRIASRYGLESIVGGVTNRGTTILPGGRTMVVPNTYYQQLTTDFPQIWRQAKIQNAHGDWLYADTASLNAAAAAGSAMNVGANNDVPGAYPLTYVTRLYTIAGTLDPDQANALAALVRYYATDAQDAIVAANGAAMPQAMRNQALAAADRIVESNCTAGTNGALWEVTTGGLSNFEPTTPKVRALTQMKHCTLKPPPAPTTTTTTPTVSSTSTTTLTTASTTTTVAAATTTTTAQVASLPPAPRVQVPQVVVPQVAVPIPSDDAATTLDTTLTDTETTTTVAGDATVDGATTTTNASVGATTTRPRGKSLSSLPLPTPSDGSTGFKKLGTLLMGASMFLFGRRVFQLRRAGQ